MVALEGRSYRLRERGTEPAPAVQAPAFTACRPTSKPNADTLAGG
jgi:hypothetical protein